jgi:hypothetical protein
MNFTKYGYCVFFFLISACADMSEGVVLKISSRKEVDQQLRISDQYADKRIAIEGYLNFSDGASEDGKENTLQMNIMGTPDASGEVLEYIKIKMGDGKNEVHVPLASEMHKDKAFNKIEKKVDLSKVTLTTNNGDVIPLTQKVKISATVTYPKDYTGKRMTIQLFTSDVTGLYMELKDIRLDAVK